MNYFLMILGLLLFFEGLVFELKSIPKPDKGFRYVGWEEGWDVEATQVPYGVKVTDKDGKDITERARYLLFVKREVIKNADFRAVKEGK